jgi:hypothetical protein
MKSLLSASAFVVVLALSGCAVIVNGEPMAAPAEACATHPGGACYAGPGGPLYAGPGGPRYAGPGGPLYAGPGGAAYAGPGGACHAGPGGACHPHAEPGKCPAVCNPAANAPTAAASSVNR